MAREYTQSQLEFLTAMGESFCERVCPPVPFESASPHECCEVVWAVFGYEVTPEVLANVTDFQLTQLREKFGEYFESEQPSIAQVKDGIAANLFRWPVGSLDNDA